MKIVNTGNTYLIYDDLLKTYDKLPAGTYSVCFSKMRGFFLEARSDLAITEKIYGVHMSKVKKIMKAFKKFERNLGVILSGQKGIGKSICAKLMAIEGVKKGYPVLFVNDYIPGIADFLSSITQECVVLFDEFDKTFKCNDGGDDAQAEMLTLFDGLDQGKKLFIITCNELRNLNDFLVNRPGRFHYHLRFNYPTVDEIREYLNDKVDDEYKGEIEQVVKFSGLTDLNYDCLRAIAFELNNGTPFKEAIQDLNITSYDNSYYYDATIYFADGTKATRKNVSVDLDRDYGECMWAVNDNRINIEFDPSAGRYDTSSLETVVQAEDFTDVTWTYDEDDDKGSKEKHYRSEPLYISFRRRTNYREIHYMA